MSSRIGAQAYYAQSTLARAIQTRAAEDVEEASIEWQKLDHDTDRHYPHREAILATTGVAFLLRWQCFRDERDLELAISAIYRALKLCRPDHSRDYYQNLANMGSALLDRGLKKQSISDIKEALDYLEEAHIIFVKRGKETSSRWEHQVCLARALHTMYEMRLAGSSSLERAIEFLDDSIPLIPNGDQGPALFLIGNCHRYLYSRRDQPHDLQRALDYLNDAQDFDLEDDKEQCLVASGIVHVDKYNRYHKIEDLDQAITTFKQAATMNTEDSSLARNVANTIYYKHKETRDPTLLDEAIEWYEVEIATADKSRGGLGRRHYAYGVALVRRFSVKGKLVDLEKGVHHLEIAVDHAHRDDMKDYEDRLQHAKDKLDRERQYLEHKRALQRAGVGSPHPKRSIDSHSSSGHTSVPSSPFATKSRPRVLKKTSVGTPVPLSPKATEKSSGVFFISSLQRALRATVPATPAKWTRQR